MNAGSISYPEEIEEGVYHVRRKFKRSILLLYNGGYRSNHGINIYISREISIEHPSVGLASLAQ